MSRFLMLNWFDFVKGLIITVIGTVVSTGYELFIDDKVLPSTWNGWWTNILLPGVLAGISYLIKNLFTNSNNQFAAREL